MRYSTLSGLFSWLCRLSQIRFDSTSGCRAADSIRFMNSSAGCRFPCPLVGPWFMTCAYQVISLCDPYVDTPASFPRCTMCFLESVCDRADGDEKRRALAIQFCLRWSQRDQLRVSRRRAPRLHRGVVLMQCCMFCSVGLVLAQSKIGECRPPRDCIKVTRRGRKATGVAAAFAVLHSCRLGSEKNLPCRRLFRTGD